MFDPLFPRIPQCYVPPCPPRRLVLGVIPEHSNLVHKVPDRLAMTVFDVGR